MIFRKDISNWGNYPSIQANVSEPTHERDVLKCIQQFGQDIIARGNGRCYGDAALADNIISTLKLNKFIAFDEQARLLTVESGVLLSDILDFCIPKGLFLPVTPGTKFITAGGALASDVHGKNHHKDGCFSDWVESFTILDAGDMNIKTCSRYENEELFWSTIGGMGLTGMILNLSFYLVSIESSYIRQESIKARDLDAIFQLFEDSAQWTYTVAWIDCLQKGKNTGRSVMMRGEHATLDELPAKYRPEALQVSNKSLMKIPFYFPGFALNKLSVKAFNWLYYNKQMSEHHTEFSGYNSFFYPLDALTDWNRVYGKKGFIQYQFVLPLSVSREGMINILNTIAGSGQGSFLSVLKLFGENNPSAYNSFPIPGYTLALDFKRNKALPALIRKLDDIVLTYGGRIYRAKDSMSDPGLTSYLHNVGHTAFNSLQHKRIVG